MQIVVGHANPDFDAYASTVAATKLFPGAKGVFLGSQNENVREFHNLHEAFLEFVDLKTLDLTAIDSLIMVDTRDPERLGELASVATRPGVDVVVYDHHQPQAGDIIGADDRSVDTGATVSILVHALMDRGTSISPLEASVMLLGIHEDTGSLTYPGTTALDAEAAAWLMEQGADVDVLNQYLRRALTPQQCHLQDQLSDGLELWDVNGEEIAYGQAIAEDYVDSAGVLGSHIVEELGHRVAVVVVQMPSRTQVIAHSRLSQVDVGRAMALLGGGGHAQAASASFRNRSADDVRPQVRAALEAVVRPPVRVADVMSSPVRTLGSSATMREAGDLMARWGHGGLPIVDDGVVAGIVTRKDVDKATGHGLGHAPVTGFMTRDVLTTTPAAEVRELERLLAARGVGRVPVLDTGKLVGIVTRTDVLRAEYGPAYIQGRGGGDLQAAAARFLLGVEALLPPEARELLRLLGEVAEAENVRVHLVGGFVRDMLLQRPNLDIDVVVEGDGISLAEKVAQRLGVAPRVHHRFGTAVVVLGGGLHIDFASARAEYYASPGALPTVERSSLRQDLFRRDFTINAMAVTVDPVSFGALEDPFDGLADLAAGVVRVLHPLSFVDDPTRVIRATRFEARYGFAMDGSTEALARRAIDLGMLGEVSGTRIREEILGILDEDEPAVALARLDALGALAGLLPTDSHAETVVARVAATTPTLRSADVLRTMKPAPRRRTTLLLALASEATPRAVEGWIRHLHLSAEHAARLMQIAEHGDAVAAALRDDGPMSDSRLYRLLRPLSAEAIVNLWARGEDVTRERLGRFVGELALVESAVDGADLIEFGATPSPGFSAILARALDDRLDGRAVGREAELANLERLARRAGLIDPRKDST